MTYEAWRISYQSSEQAARAAYAECARLQAKIEAMEKQEPVGEAGAMPGTSGFTMACFRADAVPFGSKLYALPGAQAQPAPSVPDGWLRAVDEALVATHLGVADAADNYEEAKRKLNELICWHTDVATDPAVNGGFKLVPIEPTTDMICEMEKQWFGSQIDMAKREWKAAVAAAPEAKP